MHLMDTYMISHKKTEAKAACPRKMAPCIWTSIPGLLTNAKLRLGGRCLGLANGQSPLVSH